MNICLQNLNTTEAMKPQFLYLISYWLNIGIHVIMKKGQIHIGTSGWSYKHWKEIFYPENLKTTDWLVYYTQTFAITEINASFYHLPKKTTVEKWVQNVPEDFKFCPKLSRYITHMKRLHDCEEPLKVFFDAFEPMKKKMGPVLVQLPPTLKFDHDTAEQFFSLLKENFADYRFAIEVRHNTWMNDEAFKLLSDYSISFVISQSGKGFPYAEKITAEDIYVRFHGPDKLYASRYDDEALTDFAGLFTSWKKEGHDIWAFFNNDVYGYAIENAKRLEEMVK